MKNVNLVETIATLKKHPFLSPLEIYRVVVHAYHHGKRRGVIPKTFPIYKIGIALNLDPEVIRRESQRMESQVEEAHRAATGGQHTRFRGRAPKRYVLEDNTIVQY